MRIIIFGAGGMLGHKLMQTFAADHTVYATVRGEAGRARLAALETGAEILGGVEAENLESVESAVAAAKPDAVVNAAGAVKQLAAGQDPVACITINSLFPHRLAVLAKACSARLIQFSTDCVFSGSAGNYDEDAVPDARDLYGRSKLLGEVEGEGCLTLRTSIIGRELHGAHGLLEWFLSQSGQAVRGFRRAVFSGLTTAALADIVAQVLMDHPELSGVLHVAAEPVDKDSLLNQIKAALTLDIEIQPDEVVACDRSLDGRRFLAATGIKTPSWGAMIDGLRDDETPYDRIRSAHANG